jgi:hypothetical protein
MKKRLAFEAFLTFITEGIIPDFKQVISNIFTLKSKTVTILLGTFVPFFVCHIMAYYFSFDFHYSKRIQGDFYAFFITVFVIIFLLSYILLIASFLHAIRFLILLIILFVLNYKLTCHAIIEFSFIKRY